MELTLGDLTPTGECMATWDGEPATVFGGIPGERVVAEVVRRRRDHVAIRVVEVLEASPHRIESDCAYFWPCTGCQWRHISYEHQLEIKRDRVERTLRAAPGLAGVDVLPTMPSRSTSGYRNHARFTIGPGGTLGYVNNTTRRFLRVDRCDLMHPWINDALAQLQERCAETTQLSVRYGVNTGDYLVQPRLVGGGITLESGQKHYTEAMLGQEFRVASPSFFQVNTPTAEAMVELVGEQLRLAPTDVLVDAYAGVGVFARLLADRCARVIAIEESSAAVKDARVNAEDSPTVEFRLGKTEDVLPTLEETPDALILDPSRAGCDRRALDAVLRLGPRRVAYVSCEPDALARDLAVLVEGGYRDGDGAARRPLSVHAPYRVHRRPFAGRIAWPPPPSRWRRRLRDGASCCSCWASTTASPSPASTRRQRRARTSQSGWQSRWHCARRGPSLQGSRPGWRWARTRWSRWTASCTGSPRTHGRPRRRCGRFGARRIR